MTAAQTNPEMIQAHDEGYPPGIYASRRAPKDLMDLRAEFVRRMGWAGDEHTDDSDRYDQTLSTIHLFERGPDGAIVAGMRLTQIDSIYDSLSLEMLKSNPGMYEAVLERADEIDSFASGNLWDLTRLVNAKDGDIFKAMVEVFGAGMAATDNGDENLTWLFTTTSDIKDALDAIGIKNEVLARGFISEQDEANQKLSYVCVVKTIEAFRILQEHATDEKYKFAYEHVINGRDNLSTL